MSNPPKLIAPLYVEPSSVGFCTTINNINQMSYFHSHDYFEVFLVLDGTAAHLVNGKEFSLVRGSLVFMRPNDEHCYLNPTPNFQFINLIVMQGVIAELLDYLGNGFPNVLLTNEFPSQRNLSPTSLEPLISRLRRLIIYPKLNAAQYNTVLRLAVANIISHFVDEHLFSEISSYPGWLRELISKMYEPDVYKKDLQYIFEIANCTPEHLCRTFRKCLDMTPGQFLNKIRLEEAARSIIYTDKPIIDISGEVGFDSLSNFYHQFKDQFHMSPRNYRLQSRQSQRESAIMTKE